MNTQILALNEGEHGSLNSIKHLLAQVLLPPVNRNSITNAVSFTEYHEHLWIASLYQDIFHRRYDEAGLDYWIRERMKATHPVVIVSDFCHSLEYCQSFVANLYQQLLYRSPDPDGLAYWSKELQCGASQQTVVAEFTASEEYLLRHPLPYAFVDSLYRKYLLRAPDSSGYVCWVERLQDVWSPAQVACEFLHSEEYSRRVTGDIYLEYLRREPTNEEWDYWTGALMTGQAQQQVVIRCLSSNEYRSKCIN
jgi:hypothetical protein